MASDVDTPFPTREFRVFLRELTRVERQLELLALGHLEALAPELLAPEALRDRLSLQLKGIVQRARREGFGAPPADLAQIQSVMARVGDRALAASGLPPGTVRPLSDDFPRPPLIAEDSLDQIDDLLDAEPPNGELAELYLLALAAGLEPPTDGADRSTRLATQRRMLFDRVTARRPDLLAPPGAPLFPEAYRQSQGDGAVRYLPQIRGWLAALVVALAALLAVSDWAFRKATQGLGSQLEAPLDSEARCP